MTAFEYGDHAARNVLIQPIGGGDLDVMESEIAAIKEQTAVPFRLIAVRVDDWNTDLSPWKAPAVFGKEAFKGGAENTLSAVQRICSEKDKRYLIGGYSLAGLFALWAAYQTDFFMGVAAASPSVWFPGFLPFTEQRVIQSPAVYLSLGDREERTKNPVVAAVANNIRTLHDRLSAQGADCILEWNAGNHFQNADQRTAKAFAWILNRSENPGAACSWP